MADLETLKAALKLLQACTKAADDMDEMVHAVLLPDDPWWQAIVEGRRLVAEGRADAVIDRCNCRLRADSWAKGSKVSPCAQSVDAALGLAGKVLPKWSLQLGMSEGLKHPVVVMGRSYPTNLRVAVEHLTAPLAICAGILSALIAQAEQGASHGH